MAFLTRDAILAADDRRFTEVNVPEWGGAVRICGMNAAQLLEYHEVQARGGSEHVGWLLAACVVDDSGQPVFTAEDADALRHKSPAAVLRVFNAAAALNSITTKDAEEQRGN